MRGHIVKRYKDSYTIVLNLGRDPVTGKRKQQWVTVKGTKKDAEKKLAELLHQIDSGTFLKPTKTTVAEFLERWLRDYVKPNLSPRGFERYSGIVRKHLIPDIGSLPLVQLKPEHLQKHHTSQLTKGLNPQTIRYHHAVIHKALQTALKWGLINRNAADGVDIPRARHIEMQTWTEGEVNRFLESAKTSPYYALFYIALYTGMRRSELLGLKWSDVDFILSQIYVSRSIHHLKNGKYVFTQPKSARSRRTIALPPSALLTLRDHQEKQRLERQIMGLKMEDGDLVFSQPNGRPLRPNTVTRAWATQACRAGVKIIRLHDARHTHATLMLKQGIHPKVVQERLGHSSIQMTIDTYSHVTPGLQQAAAEGFDKMLSRQSEALGSLG